MSNKLTIFVACHTPGMHVENDIYKPIHVGRALSDVKLDMIGDDTGDNISNLNPYFCESTAMYWVWKNFIESEYVGFCHYRRLFYMNSYRKHDLDDSLFLHRPFFCDSVRKEIGVDKTEELVRILDDYDSIFPLRTPTILWGSQNIINQVGTIPQLNYKFYNATPLFVRSLDVLREMYPEMRQEIDDTMFNQDSGYFYNIFVMKREMFNAYCEWLFPFLLRMNDEVDYSLYSQAEMRSLAFFVERYFNIYVNWRQKHGDFSKIKEIPVVMIDKPNVLVNPVSVIDRENSKMITVCIPVADYSLESSFLTIESLFNLPNTNEYRTVMIDRGLNPRNKKRLSQFLGACMPEFSFAEIALPWDPNLPFDIVPLTLIHSLNEGRIIYLEPGSIVFEDLQDLFFSTGVSGIAAINDIDIYANIKSGRMIFGIDYAEFLEKRIGISNPKNCFNDSVFAMDLDILRERGTMEKMMDGFLAPDKRELGRKWFLNSIFANECTIVDYKWGCSVAAREQEKAPYDLSKQFIAAARNPAIVSWDTPDGVIDSVDIRGSCVEGALYRIARHSPLLAARIAKSCQSDIARAYYDVQARVQNLETSVSRLNRFANFVAKLPLARRTYKFLTKYVTHS